MLIGLTGYSGSGKDTVAAHLAGRYGFERRAFADKLRELAYAQDPLAHGRLLRLLVDAFGWDHAKRKYPQVRRILQNTGQAHREVFGEDFWVNQVLPGMLKSAALRDWSRLNIVVTDVRYPNEAKRVRDLGGRVVEVRRPGYGAVNDHTSEQRIPADRVLHNNLGVSALQSAVSLLLEEMCSL